MGIRHPSIFFVLETNDSAHNEERNIIDARTDFFYETESSQLYLTTIVAHYK